MEDVRGKMDDVRWKKEEGRGMREEERGKMLKAYTAFFHGEFMALKTELA